MFGYGCALRHFRFLWEGVKRLPGGVLPERVCRAGATAGAKALGRGSAGRAERVQAVASGPWVREEEGRPGMLARAAGLRGMPPSLEVQGNMGACPTSATSWQCDSGQVVFLSSETGGVWTP